MAASTMTLVELSDRIARDEPPFARRQATFVVDPQGRLAGIVTRGDLVRALQDDAKRSLALGEIATTDVETAFPDETLQDAVARMLKRGIGRLPVVAREEPTRIVGYLGRADILAARSRRHEEEEVRERGPLLTRIAK